VTVQTASPTPFDFYASDLPNPIEEAVDLDHLRVAVTPARAFAEVLEFAVRSGSEADLTQALLAAEQAEAAGVDVHDVLELAGDVAQATLDSGSCSPSVAMEALRRVTSQLVAGRVGDRDGASTQLIVGEGLFTALAGGGRLDSEQEGQLRAYGLPPSCPLMFPVGMVLVSASAATHAAVASDLRRRDVLAIAVDRRVLALLPSPPSPALIPAGATSITCPPAPRDDLPLAIARLRRALDLAMELELRGRVAFDDLLIDLLLAESPTLAGELAARVCCLAEDGEDRLLTTVRTFLDCRARRATAASALHIHPNTLDLRLKRIHELTGLDLRLPDDLVRLVLGLRAAERAAEGCPGPVPEFGAV
jgi:hypothetical protein